MTATEFQLPVFFDLAATFAFGLTGALAGIKRGYDIVGVFFLALVSSIGGGLIRDGVFIKDATTPLLTDPRYIETITVAVLAGVILGSKVTRFQRTIAVIDALGLGAYAAFGTQKALHANLAAPAAILVGVINAAGGGLMRDIITREEPLVFKPGQFYVLTALARAVTFLTLTVSLHADATLAAITAIAMTFVFRLLAIALNWRTSPVAGLRDVTP